MDDVEPNKMNESNVGIDFENDQATKTSSDSFKEAMNEASMQFNILLDHTTTSTIDNSSS